MSVKNVSSRAAVRKHFPTRRMNMPKGKLASQKEITGTGKSKDFIVAANQASIACTNNVEEAGVTTSQPQITDVDFKDGVASVTYTAYVQDEEADDNS